jgi:hypothetical protein
LEERKLTRFVAKSIPSFNYSIGRLAQQISTEAGIGTELMYQITEQAINEWQFQRKIPVNTLFVMSHDERYIHMQEMLKLFEGHLRPIVASKRRLDRAVNIAEENIRIALDLR